jgi:hypothetical protein
MEKYIIELVLGTVENINLKKEIIPLNIFTLQQIITFINEDSNYIFPDNFLDLWDVFKVELQKYRISAHNKVSFIITSAQVKKVQNIVKPFKDMIQNTIARHNSIFRYSHQVSDPTEMSEYLFKYNEKSQQKLMPYTYQNFLLEKAHQNEFERSSEMERWRLEDEARKYQEIEELRQEELRQEELRQEELRQEELRQEELRQQLAIEKEKEDYEKLCLDFYKHNIKNRSNTYCLFHIHPYKVCNMKSTGKKCGFKHEYPPIELLKEPKKSMKRSNSK